ncbi:hypothetical protein HM131_11865 [Halobacillus mangrovi]|uniref:Uncharacterized protein n=1 Tax=Halobacillus mangrovi TaxID=402384 RepID=A0A1W5ZVZ7_9BACI|nr:hypothetical protein HM131_11865 [Halobacillus mangrovi]
MGRLLREWNGWQPRREPGERGNLPSSPRKASLFSEHLSRIQGNGNSLEFKPSRKGGLNGSNRNMRLIIIHQIY